jgi:phosphopantetheinyl transferase (holo-ACP synthase)
MGIDIEKIERFRKCFENYPIVQRKELCHIN